MRGLNVIWAMARGTLLEAMRNRVFLGLTLTSILFLVFSLVLSQLSLRTETARVALDFGFFTISLFAVAVGITIGVILVFKEVAQKTIYAVLPKPVRRYEFVLGKYLGLVLLLALEILILGIAWWLVLTFRGAPVSVELAKGLYLIFLEAAVVTSAAVLFSAFTSPHFSGIFALGIFMVGRLLGYVEELLAARKGLFVDHPELRPFGDAIVRVFPDLGVFDISDQVLFNIDVPAVYVVSATGYAVAWIALFIALGTLLFQRRDFI
jgi:ABC-type transport system involved in multi-copper enzyme maturation permease subunit